MFNLRSKLRRDLLAYYFTNPAAGHHLRELARLLHADPANLSRELNRLESQGLFSSAQRGRQKYFQLNKNYALYQELRRIISKTVGAFAQLKQSFEKLHGIQEARIYGSFARDQQDASSDIDVLIVGRPGPGDLDRVVRQLESRLGREINYTVLSPQEFKARKSRKDAFLEDIYRRKSVALVEVSC